MAFRLSCPKCGSHNVHIETDRARGWGNPEPMLHCPCGKMVYGEKAIEALYREQQAAWKAGAKDRAVSAWERQEQEAAKTRAARLAEEAHKRHRQERAAKKIAEAEAKRLETLRWLEEARARRAAEDEAARRKAAPPKVTVAESPGDLRGRLAFPCAHCGPWSGRSPTR